MNIIDFSIIFISLICGLIIDLWSTRVAFRYNDLIVNNEEFRNGTINALKTNRYETELNPLGRLFMKKFGVTKGMIVLSSIWHIPMFLFFSFLVLFELTQILYVVPLVTFYLGGITMQTVKSISANESIRKFKRRN